MYMSHKSRWNTYYQSLVQYQHRFGDALVPTSHVEFIDNGTELNLGNWVSYMRSRYKQNCLSLERVRLLEEVPTWTWGPVRPGPKSRDDVMLRNKDIVTQRNKGTTLANIAKQYGLSRQRVHQIIKENVSE